MLGLSKVIAIRVIDLFSFYITQSIIKHGSVHIKGVGDLQCIKNKRGVNTYHFKPTTLFKSEVSKSTSNYLSVLTQSYKDLGITESPVEIEEYRGEPKVINRLKRKDKIQQSLLLYLQRDFPYDYPWKHPTTKKVYGCGRFKAAIKILKTHYPEGYECFFAIWVSLSKKKYYLDKLRVNEKEFLSKADKSLTLILQIVVNEDLEPSRMNKLFNINYYL